MTSAIASWYAGTTRQVVTTVKDIQGNPVDLTGALARFVMVKSLSGEVITVKSIGDGITLDIPNSKVTVDIDPTDTLSHVGDHELQLEIMLANGVVLMAYDVIVSLKKNYSNIAE
jgi:hypothetical protein